jgi:hypothetical protein
MPGRFSKSQSNGLGWFASSRFIFFCKRAPVEKEAQQMNREQFEREKNYLSAISIAKALLSRRLITAKEYGKIDTMLINKYRPLLGGLRTEKP